MSKYQKQLIHSYEKEIEKILLDHIEKYRRITGSMNSGTALADNPQQFCNKYNNLKHNMGGDFYNFIQHKVKTYSIIEKRTVISIKRMKSDKSKVLLIFKKLRPIQEKRDRMQQILDILDEDDLNPETLDEKKNCVYNHNICILKQAYNRLHIPRELKLFEEADSHI